MLARVRTQTSLVIDICGAHNLFSGQREREIDKERVRARERER
jgi:hypothetical protein